MDRITQEAYYPSTGIEICGVSASNIALLFRDGASLYIPSQCAIIKGGTACYSLFLKLAKVFTLRSGFATDGDIF